MRVSFGTRDTSFIIPTLSYLKMKNENSSHFGEKRLCVKFLHFFFAVFWN